MERWRGAQPHRTTTCDYELHAAHPPTSERKKEKSVDWAEIVRGLRHTLNHNVDSIFRYKMNAISDLDQMNKFIIRTIVLHVQRCRSICVWYPRTIVQESGDDGSVPWSNEMRYIRNETTEGQPRVRTSSKQGKKGPATHRMLLTSFPTLFA